MSHQLISVCLECNAHFYDHNNEPPHSPLCSHNTPEQTLKHLKIYFECYQKFYEERQRYTAKCAEWRNDKVTEMSRLLGKLAILKRENNQLRKKLYPGKS